MLCPAKFPVTISSLPELLKTHPTWWVAYYGAERIELARTHPEIYRLCERHPSLDWSVLLIGCVEPAQDWDYIVPLPLVGPRGDRVGMDAVFVERLGDMAKAGDEMHPQPEIVVLAAKGVVGVAADEIGDRPAIQKAGADEIVAVAVEILDRRLVRQADQVGDL